MPENNKTSFDEKNVADIDATFAQAQTEYERENWSQAIALFQRFHGFHESDEYENRGVSYNRMGVSYAMLKDYDRSIECFQLAVTSPGYEGCGGAWCNLGMSHSHLNNHENSIESYKRALDSPSYIVTGFEWLNMGVAYASLNDPAEAIKCYQKAIDISGFGMLGEAWINKGKAHKVLKDYDRAIECFVKGIQVPGYEVTGGDWNHIGASYAALNNYKGAIECYEKALDSVGYETPAYTWYNMGNVYLALKDYDLVISSYQKALEIPGFKLPGGGWSNMGAAYAGLEKHDCAIECYKKSLEIAQFETQAGVWYNLASSYAKLRNYAESIKCYRKALSAPGYAPPGDVMTAMGRSYIGLGEYEEAIDLFRRAIDIPGNNHSEDAWGAMGIAYDAMQDFEKAIECFQKALETVQSADLGGLLSRIGVDLAELKHYERAIEYFQQSAKNSEYLFQGNAWLNMANCYNRLKNYELAIECGEKALQVVGFEYPSDALNIMGDAYFGLRDFNRAAECYQHAINELPNDQVCSIRNNLALTLLHLNLYKEAESEIYQVFGEGSVESDLSRAQELLDLIKARRLGIQIKPDEFVSVAPSFLDVENSPEARIREALINRDTAYEKYLKQDRAEHPDELSILRGWSSSVTLLEGSDDNKRRGGGYFFKWKGKGVVIDPGFDFLNNFHDAGFHVTEVNAVVVSHNHHDHNGDLLSLDDLCYEVHKTGENISPFIFVMDEDTALTFPNDDQRHRVSPCKLSKSDYEMKRWLKNMHGLPISIEHFPVAHGADVPNAMGLIFRLHNPDGGADIVIGYTGDGEYTEDLLEHLRCVDILIAHVSQPDPQELTDPDHRKKTHLGYNGVINLVREIEPRLTLVGEFWAGLADSRLDIIDGIRLRSGVQAVLPACIGLSLSLPDFIVRCTRCCEGVPAEHIELVPPIKEFGLLGYLCPDCISKNTKIKKEISD